MDLTEVKHFEQQQVGKLKLSDAMRIGARIRPQCRGSYKSAGRSCALGAVFEAVYGRPSDSSERVDTLLEKQFPELKKGRSWLGSKIVDLNDAGWTRERIADWLESKGL